MTGAQAAAIIGVGMVAGAINAVVGSGTLVTFPTLLAFGYPPVTANVTNTLGLVPGSIAGAYGYRRELAGQRARAVRLGVAAALGGLAGALLLLVLPPEAFRAVAPALIALAVVLVLAQPRLARRLAADPGRAEAASGAPGGPLTVLAVFGVSVYGGYFGAAQGVLLLAVLGIAFHQSPQRRNAVKNVLAAVVNLVAALVFVVVAHIAWPVAGLLAVGSIAGGLLGARFGRRLPPLALRVVVVVVGVVAVARLLIA